MSIENPNPNQDPFLASHLEFPSHPLDLHNIIAAHQQALQPTVEAVPHVVAHIDPRAVAQGVGAALTAHSAAQTRTVGRKTYRQPPEIVGLDLTGFNAQLNRATTGDEPTQEIPITPGETTEVIPIIVEEYTPAILGLRHARAIRKFNAITDDYHGNSTKPSGRQHKEEHHQYRRALHAGKASQARVRMNNMTSMLADSQGRDLTNSSRGRTHREQLITNLVKNAKTYAKSREQMVEHTTKEQKPVQRLSERQANLGVKIDHFERKIQNERQIRSEEDPDQNLLSRILNRRLKRRAYKQDDKGATAQYVPSGRGRLHPRKAMNHYAKAQILRDRAAGLTPGPIRDAVTEAAKIVKPVTKVVKIVHRKAAETRDNLGEKYVGSLDIRSADAQTKAINDQEQLDTRSNWYGTDAKKAIARRVVKNDRKTEKLTKRADRIAANVDRRRAERAAN